VLILALDTSGDVCSVALTEDAALRGVIAFRHERRLGERLPRALQFLLADAAVTLAAVDLLAVGRGPGSFTGVRVGVTMAKTLAQTLDKPLVGVSSLRAIAFPLMAAAGPGALVVAVTPARRGVVVAAAFPGGGDEAAGPDVVAVEDVALWASRVAARPNASSGADRLIVCGEASVAPLGEIIAPAGGVFGGGVIAVDAAPSAAVVARLAYERVVIRGGAPDDCFTLTPLYVAPTPVG